MHSGFKLRIKKYGLVRLFKGLLPCPRSCLVINANLQCVEMFGYLYFSSNRYSFSSHSDTPLLWKGRYLADTNTFTTLFNKNITSQWSSCHTLNILYTFVTTSCNHHKSIAYIYIKCMLNISIQFLSQTWHVPNY